MNEPTTDEKFWLAVNCYHEAQGEPFEGKVAVCHTVLQRVAERKQSVRDVIFSPHQYSWTGDKLPDVIRDYAALLDCFKAVDACYRRRENGNTLSNINHYYNPNKCSPEWAGKMKKVTVIGNHIFLRG
jgi:N-acetylmuramoyl-L-alanine amidase